MKLLRRKSKSHTIPSTLEWKMTEYNRLYSAKSVKEDKKKGDAMSISVNGKPLVEINPKASMEDVQSIVNSLNQDINSKVDEIKAKANSISIDGKTLLEINPNAKLEDVQAFLNSLQQEVNCKVAEVAAKVDDDEVFNRNADAVVKVVDDYEETLGKRFKRLQQRLADDAYEEKLGKSFRSLQRSLARKSQTMKTGKSSSDSVSGLKSCADSIADSVNDDIDLVDKNAKEVSSKTSKMGSSIRNFFQNGSPKQQQKEVAVIAAPEEDESNTVPPPLPSETPHKASTQNGETVRDGVDAVVQAVIEKELFVKESGAAPKEGAGSPPAPQEMDDAPVSLPSPAPNGEAVSPSEPTEDEVQSPSPEEPNLTSVVSATTALDDVLNNESVTIDEKSTVTEETFQSRLSGIFDDISRATSFGARSSPVGVDDDISLEPSIEAVEQDKEILLGFYEPDSDTKPNGDEDVFYLEDAGYVLSLVIDGVVLHTMTVGAAAMEILMRISDAMQSQCGHGKDHTMAQEEEDCASGTISPILIENDLSEEETEEDVNAMSKEPEQSFIHPMIMEKWNEFFGPAKPELVQ